MQIGDIVAAVAAGVMSLSIALFMRSMSKRDKRAEERFQQIVEGQVRQKKYMRATGSMAFYTARAAHNAKLCNGEVEAAMQYYKKCEHELDDYLQEQDIIQCVKNN